MRRECSTCHWFDPTEEYCALLEIYCHGHDGKKCEDHIPMRVRKGQIWTEQTEQEEA